MQKDLEKIVLNSYKTSIEERFESLSFSLFGVGTRVHCFSIQYKLDLESELKLLGINFLVVASRDHTSPVEQSCYNLYIIEEEVLIEHIVTAFGVTKLAVSYSVKNELNKSVDSILHLLKKVTKNPNGDTFLLKKSYNNKWFPVPFKFQPNIIKLEHFLEPLEMIKLRDISKDIISQNENYYPIVRLSGPNGTGQLQVVHTLLRSLGRSSYTLDLTNQTEPSESSMNNLKSLLLDKKNIALIIYGISKSVDLASIVTLLKKKAVFAPVFIISKIDIFNKVELRFVHPFNIQTIKTNYLNEKQISILNEIYSTEIHNHIQWSLDEIQWSIDDIYSINGKTHQQASNDIGNDVLL